MNPTDTPIPHPEVVLREDLADWAILFHPLTGEAVGVGPVGVTIWKLLDGQRTLEEVAAALAAQCKGAPATILADILTFVNDLERRLFVLTGPLTRPAPSPTAPEPRPFPQPASNEGRALSLADGTRLALCAGDETAARVVDFLAEVATLTPSPRPPFPSPNLGRGEGGCAKRGGKR